MLGALVLSDNRVGWAPPQALRDYRGDLEMAIGESGPTEELRATWKRSASASVSTKGGGAEANAEQPAKRVKYRHKSYEWLLSVENMLQVSTGCGLKRYVYTEEEMLEKPFDMPVLWLAADQGSDGVCAIGFLRRHLSANVIVSYDTSHGCWNDVKLALRASHLYSFQLLMVVIFNLSYGPWNEARWFVQTREALLEFLDHMVQDPDNDPLLCHLAPAIIADSGGCESDLRDTGALRQVADNLRDASCFWVKGQKVGLCRFFGAHKAAKEFDSSWHSRLLGLVYCGLMTGSIKRSSFIKLLGGRLQQQAAHVDRDDEKTRVPQGNEALKQLRSATKNTFELATLILCDATNQTIQRQIATVCDQLERWHGLQNCRLREVTASQEWVLDQCDGAYSKHCKDILGSLGNLAELDRCGLVTPLVGVCGDLEHPFVGLANDGANRMASLAFSLVFNRLKRHMELLAGWPDRFCFAYHPDRAKAAQMLEVLRRDYENFKLAEARTSPFWKKVTRRSIFQTMHMNQIIAICESEGGQVTPKLRAGAMERERALRSSQLIEDGFQRERRHEEQGTNNQASCDRTWAVLLRKKKLEQVHKYDPVIPDAASTKSETIKTSIFAPQPKQQSVNLKQVMGFNKTLQWVSFSPQTAPVVFADMQLTDWCRRANTWASANSVSGRSILAQGNLLLRNRQTNGPWFFALSHVAVVMLVGWPAERRRLDTAGVDLWVPGPAFLAFEFPWLVVFVIGEWEAMPFEWLSPMYCKVLCDDEPVIASGGIGIAAKATSEPSPLLTVAARACFWDLPVVPLRALARFLGRQLPPSTSLAVVLAELLTFILQCSEEDMLDIMALRVSPNASDVLDDLVETDEAGDMLDKSDFEELKKIVTEAKLQTSEKASYFEEFRALRKKAYAKTTAGKRAKTKAEGPPCAKLKGRRYLNRFPVGEDDISPDAAQEVAPPEWHVCLDPVNSRWLLRACGVGSVSRSFGAYGVEGALKAALQVAWRSFLAKQGLDCRSCPVAGIFDDAPLSAAGGAASSSSR